MENRQIVKCFMVRHTAFGLDFLAVRGDNRPEMMILYGVLLCLLNACWLATVFFYLPGNWMIVLTTGLLAWWQRDAGVISGWTVGVMAAVALVGEVIEFLSGISGAKKAGAGWKASLAAIVGALVGAVVGTVLVPIPFVGTLLGGCIGAGLATWSVERAGGKQKQDSVKSGLGAGVGVFIGTAAKIAIGAILWLTAAAAVFF